MYLRKSIKNLQKVVWPQKCLNWCQIVANRRYLSEDNKDNKDTDNEDNKSLEKVEQKTMDSEDKVVVAKHHLNNLINNLKTKNIFGESDPKLNQLLAKPKFHIRKSARPEPQLKSEDNINEISDQIDKRLVLAAKGIANTLSGEESKKTENDLLKLLKLQVLETNLAKTGKTLSYQDLTSLLGDMKIVKEEPKEDKYFKTELKLQNRFSEPKMGTHFEDRPKKKPFEDKFYEQSLTHSMLSKRRNEPRGEPKDRINLFSGEDIGIFESDMKETTDSPKMLIWDRLRKDELEYIVAQPPKNGFEEMIQWTEEGKLWKYPINNEQGLEEEEKVPFYEHVLLDHLLEGFPQTGPVKRFMELVIMGLSSNPYITVERKHATVEFYRQYFKEREDMLQIAGALG